MPLPLPLPLHLCAGWRRNAVIGTEPMKRLNLHQTFVFCSNQKMVLISFVFLPEMTKQRQLTACPAKSINVENRRRCHLMLEQKWSIFNSAALLNGPYPIPSLYCCGSDVIAVALQPTVDECWIVRALKIGFLWSTLITWSFCRHRLHSLLFTN